MRISSIILAGMLAVFTMHSALAEVVRLPANNITAVLISKDNFGGCMAQVDIDISKTAPECGSSYVTFDCNGDFQDPSIGNRFLEMAQVAYVTNKKMRFSIDTNLQHNGVCTAVRADLK
ncbi:hypothetical protein [Idiomarina sp.]|uniref:hypothetical protein n=1 Tax=Idiomarina sp. TaxID=1874361 RepID=UPI00260CE1D1|nr:hypothetical protein [Idiomarina sp.]